MPYRTPVFIVTSSRPRVGKTLIARALTEFFVAQRRAVAAFDANPDDFRLADTLPAFAAPASLRDTRGEMALFDRLIMADDVPKVVDLSHGLFERFFAVTRDTDFLNAARRNGVAPMVLFMADADQRGWHGYSLLGERFPALPLVALLNEHLPRLTNYMGSFALSPTPHGGAPIRVPALTPVVRSVVERPGFSFVGYLMKNADPTAELYQWLHGMFVAFWELEVRLLLGGLQPQLRHSA